jgi:tetratricopeptide (TPR) repeat protein
LGHSPLKANLMKNALFSKLILIILPCAAVFSGCASKHTAQSGLPSAPTAEATLASIPVPGATSATDRGIAKWIGKVRENGLDDKSWVNLGDSLMQKPRETADFHYYGYAEQAYQQALAHNPKNADALTGMAWVTSDRHQFDQSVNWANQAVALNPQNNMAYGLLGDADVELGHYNDAYAHYQKMLDIRPDTSSYSRGAHLLYLTGNSRKATWLMAKAIKTGAPYAENTAWCSTQLALMLMNQGAVIPAEQVLQDAIKSTPDNFRVLAAMGMVQAAKRNYPAAIMYYKKSLAIAPELTSTAALGDLYAVTGNKAEADRQYAQVEALHKQNTDISIHDHMQMAQFYADHDRNLVQAMQFAEEHKLTKNVNEADTLAWCYYKNGMQAQAKAAITTALAQNTSDARIFFHAGMIYAKDGNRISAGKFLSQALSVNPNFSPVFAKTAADTLKELGSRPPGAVVAARQTN